MKKFLLSAFAASAFGTLCCEATTVLYNTDFNNPPYTDALLTGQDSWLNSSGTTNFLAVANSATDGTVTLTTSGEDVRRLFTPATTTGSIFLKAEITVASAQSGDYFLHLGDGGAANFYARTYIRTATGGFQMALGTSSGAVTYGTTVLSLNTAYTILVRYDINAGTTNDTGALFINPTTEDGVGDTPYVLATTIGTDATTISSVHLRQGGAGTAPGLTVDSISVFTVPEPGSALLGAIGFLTLLRRRR